MGEYLARQGFRPEKILCSTSARTRETREAMAPSYGELPATEYREELYLASPQQILALLRETPDTIGSVMVIGHNPGIHQCALHLAMNDASPAYRQLLFDFPTAALAVLSFADLAHWQEIQAGNGAVDAYAVGRKLG
jgi:phosphohistidine phosphatase